MIRATIGALAELVAIALFFTFVVTAAATLSAMYVGAIVF